MTAQGIIAEFTRLGIRLSRDSDKLRWRGPAEIMTPDRLDILRRHKVAILAALAPQPTGCSWREDAEGKLWFSDGCCYAPLADGSGWVLVRHPTRRMFRPGTAEVRK